MLPAHVTGSRSMLAAVQRDFARLRTLEHPSIARLLELGCNGQQYYVTGERLDGEPLREVLNHLLPERLATEEADAILRAVGSALVYSHERDVAHGDVRAENVVVTMDGRFVLTNFLARRVAKMASRPPRASDDLKGLARLAAELYVGSISLQALRSAAHGEVPAARLNAIRTVLEPSNRRPSSVAEFLAAAGLEEPTPSATPRQIAVTMQKPQRSWSIWRLVLPMAAVAVLGSLGAAYHGGFGVSAEELKVRGLDALRAVAARVASPADEAPQSNSEAVPAPAPIPEPEPLEPAEIAAGADLSPPADVSPPSEISRPSSEEPLEAPVVEARPAAAMPSPPAAREDVGKAAAASPAPSPTEPPVVSLGVPRIAAREDHSVIAIDVVRSGDTAHEAAVAWWTTPDTAHQDEDYADVGRQTVTFAAGATVQRVLIPIVNDGVRESEEAFTLHIGRPRGGVAGGLTATRVTLHDDD
jgi:hypothetical protein